MGGAMCKLWKQEPVKVMYFGLDAAGKTTLLYRLKLGEVVTTIPTIGFNVETVDFKKLQLVIWDVGTRSKSRPLYRHYIPGSHGIVFVVDSNDRERLTEAVDDFFSYAVGELKDQDIPIVVLANKQDLENALSADEVKQAILKRGTIHSAFEVFPTTATTLEGVDAAFDWLTTQIALKLGKEGVRSYLAPFYNAVNYPAEFLKTSFHNVSGLFSVKPVQAEDERLTT